jgi:hypothetical protein
LHGVESEPPIHVSEKSLDRFMESLRQLMDEGHSFQTLLAGGLTGYCPDCQDMKKAIFSRFVEIGID